ncbi:hypothetical protein [Legionella bononiensis]|uniref:DUF3575 domain-containing protein n=1 Tax=Legionella bononiensis TaxID=2793102 RepID=A0ABS1W8E1_9GAMM|nr:hypothetical protein [Legionella bononiensis]MBL7479859.1 hypothetical protein [Legionella bononiensis]MBL7525626.1 hypothetical protein [Legionella bononiensis]MBL7561809.1 hypothetical protein [Legionella bononiensis]
MKIKLGIHFPIILLAIFGICSPTVFAGQGLSFDLAPVVLKKIWGKPSPTQLIFLPIGFHFFNQSNTMNNEQWLIALNYQGFIGGTFVNSANRRVYFGGVERQIYKHGRLSIDYLLGIMQGYKGEGLSHLGRVLSHDPGPLVSFTATWLLTEHLAINLATYGVGGLGGISYYF